jgi:hypothetical protein
MDQSTAMKRSSRVRGAFYGASFALLLGLASSDHAFADQVKRSSLISARLNILEAKINELKVTHDQMIENQIELQEQLTNLKIWINRRRAT